MAEWLKAAVLKTVVGQPTGGSNPSFSAIFKKPAFWVGFFEFDNQMWNIVESSENHFQFCLRNT
jgi:hypothetical protein